MNTAGILVGAAIGLSIGNYFYQAVADRNWAHATELSFFQIVAIVLVGVMLMLDHVRAS